MGNNSSSTSADLANPTISAAEGTFKVDNINSCGRKHAAAKIQVSNDSICIRQKHRQSLHIPLEAIKRYGLDGSIFILECGRRAPLGQARYAFRCKHARRLVDCLDQRISVRSRQLLEQQRRAATLSPSSTLTNLSANAHHRRRRRTQSDQGVSRRAPSSILLSSSSSACDSFASRATFSCRNSVPDLSENYLPFDALMCATDDNGEARQFVARLKQPVEAPPDPQLHYVEFAANKEGKDQTDVAAVIFILRSSGRLRCAGQCQKVRD